MHEKLDGRIEQILVEAGNHLTDLTQNIRFEWNLADNRGAKRYLQMLFVNEQVITHIENEGAFRIFEIERTLSKFQDKFPAYIKMLEKLKSIEGKPATSFHSFLNKRWAALKRSLRVTKTIIIIIMLLIFN